MSERIHRAIVARREGGERETTEENVTEIRRNIGLLLGGCRIGQRETSEPKTWIETWVIHRRRSETGEGTFFIDVACVLCVT